MTRPGTPVRGWFITIEGPEGAGKTTQAVALAKHLGERGLDVHVTREPGGTGPFATRSQALAAEVAWLETHRLVVTS